jgi:hypothetical protein
MKSKKVHVWLKQKIASSLPSNCSWCDTDDSEKWVPLLLCDSSSIHNNTHYILCGNCYDYYDKCESNYRFWIEKNLKTGGSCSCGGVDNGK